MKDYIYNQYDLEAAKILDDFLPERLFDTHIHVSHLPMGGPHNTIGIKEYLDDMKPLVGNRQLNCNAIVFPTVALKDPDELKKSVDFLKTQLDLFEGNVGEINVLPNDTVEDLEKQLIHPDIKGFKCYHVYQDKEKTFFSNIGEYLPESAWEVANKRKMFITLHMVKDDALADKDNLAYIKEMAKKYPDAVLILAHAARSFAPWTIFDTIEELIDLENVWFDFSAICEPTAISYIVKKVGIKRCMWGSDYPVSMLAGKCISIGDTFYWIYEKDLKNFVSPTTLHTYHVGTEGFMAALQMSKLLDLSRSDIEDYFYKNAERLMK